MTLGFAFLYLPILLLVIYSFNELEAGHGLGRLLDQWYAALLGNEALIDAAWVTLRVALLSATVGDGPRHAGGDRARPLRPLPRPARCSPA